MTAFLGWAALVTIAALPAIPWRRKPDPGDQQRRQELDAAIRERADQAQARWDQRQATWQQEAITGRQRASLDAAAQRQAIAARARRDQEWAALRDTCHIPDPQWDAFLAEHEGETAP